MRSLLFVLALAACSQPPEPEPAAPPAEISALDAMPTWDGARAAGVDFRGIGQEPGWMIDIYTQDRIALLLDYGETLLTFPRSAPNTAQEGVTQYDASAEGRTLRVTIRRFPCQDSMSGEAFPATVEVNIDGRVLNGCGRSV